MAGDLLFFCCSAIYNARSARNVTPAYGNDWSIMGLWKNINGGKKSTVLVEENIRFVTKVEENIRYLWKNIYVFLLKWKKVYDLSGKKYTILWQ